MHRLHSGAKWEFRIKGYFVCGALGVLLGTWLVIPAIAHFLSLIRLFLSLIITNILFVIIASEIYAQMSYNRWFYEFTDDGLRLERGVIWKKYSNIPYERIQNVDIKRGLLARLLGFSTVLIQTAGYSAQSNAEGYIPAVGVKHAEEIREFLLKNITGRGRIKYE